MAQINLLKQNTGSEKVFSNVTSVVVKLLVVIVLGLVGYYAYLFLEVSKVNKDIAMVEKTISTEQAKISGVGSQEELAMRQAQLKEADQLIKSHVYWTTMLPELAKITLRSHLGRYTAITARADGTTDIALKTPTLEDMDKFLQVFDQPSVYKNFNNVSISAINKERVDEQIFRSIQMRLKYNPDLLKYSDQYSRRR